MPKKAKKTSNIKLEMKKLPFGVLTLEDVNESILRGFAFLIDCLNETAFCEGCHEEAKK